MIHHRHIDLAEPAHQGTQQETDQLPTRGRVTYQEAGEGPAVVFLHGIGAGASTFALQLEAFAAAGYRAIAWDMPGYGGSSPLPLVSIDALTATLGAFLAGLGLDRPVIVGHSLGGMLLLRLLSVAPHAAGGRGAEPDQRRVRIARSGLGAAVCGRPDGPVRRRPQHGGLGARHGRRHGG